MHVDIIFPTFVENEAGMSARLNTCVGRLHCRRQIRVEVFDPIYNQQLIQLAVARLQLSSGHIICGLERPWELMHRVGEYLSEHLEIGLLAVGPHDHNCAYNVSHKRIVSHNQPLLGARPKRRRSLPYCFGLRANAN